MAGTKRHIDQVLKSKLGNHQAKVDESDWAAFEQFLDTPKKTSRRVIYFRWAAAFLVLLGLVAGITYFSLDSTSSEQIVNTQTVEPQSQSQTQTQTQPEAQSQSQPEINTELQSQPQPQTQSEQGMPSRRAQPQPQPKTQSQPNFSTDITRQSSLDVKTISPRVLLIPTPSWGWFEHALLPPYQAKEEEKQDTGAAPGNNKIKSFLPPLGPSVAVGIVYGFGTPELSLKQGDPSQVHEDYNSALKGAKNSSQTFRLLAQYEYRLKFGLQLSAGLQMSSSVQVQQFSFENRKIPYFGTNGEIITYFVIPGSQPVPPTEFESRQNTYSATVPLNIGYTYRFGSKFSMGVRAQAGLGLNWAKSYSGLDPKTLAQKDNMNSSVNPLNFSFGGGLFGEYLYLEKWSVRASFDWTKQNLQYQNSNSYNMLNRYFECKLSLVRYL